MSAAVERLSALVEQWTGIALERGGRFASLETFVAERVKGLGLADAEAYVASLHETHAEVARLLEAITVPYTWFYRDEEQMVVIARLLREEWPSGRPVQAWIPGCATGEDAWTVAMLATLAEREVQVLATDINHEALAHAQAGRYGAWSRRALPEALLQFFVPAPRGAHGIAPGLRSKVHFAVHNLKEPPPPPPLGGEWDLILCRNVLIYFRPQTIIEVHQRLGQSLSVGGWLLFGASEVVYGAPGGLVLTNLEGRMALHRRRPGDGRFDEAPAPAAFPGPPARASAPPPPEAPSPPPAPRPSAPAPSAPPRSALEWVSQGNQLLRARRLEEALAAYGEARERDPLCVEALLFMGMAWHLAGEPAKAVADLRAALFLDPQLWPAEFYLALSLENLGRADLARKHFGHVVHKAQQPVRIESAGSPLDDLEAWRSDVLGLARRRAAKRSPSHT